MRGRQAQRNKDELQFQQWQAVEGKRIVQTDN
jgi:hypothetical protein